jgi:hypothetical protein
MLAAGMQGMLPTCDRSGKMRDNLSGRDLEYYQRREREERERAARADDTIARRLHLELAERYSTMLQSPAQSQAQA